MRDRSKPTGAPPLNSRRTAELAQETVVPAGDQGQDVGLDAELLVGQLEADPDRVEELPPQAEIALAEPLVVLCLGVGDAVDRQLHERSREVDGVVRLRDGELAFLVPEDRPAFGDFQFVQLEHLRLEQAVMIRELAGLPGVKQRGVGRHAQAGEGFEPAALLDPGRGSDEVANERVRQKQETVLQRVFEPKHRAHVLVVERLGERLHLALVSFDDSLQAHRRIGVNNDVVQRGTVEAHFTVRRDELLH
jgi:hypothetical protein